MTGWFGEKGWKAEQAVSPSGGLAKPILLGRIVLRNFSLVFRILINIDHHHQLVVAASG